VTQFLKSTDVKNSKIYKVMTVQYREI